MKYRFRICLKNVANRKQINEQIYPLGGDLVNYYQKTLSFVQQYFNVYYGDNDNSILLDRELVSFYNAWVKYCDINSKFTCRKHNVINVLTHCICNGSVWDSHLNGAVSFEYSIDSDFTGLQISWNNSMGNNMLQYVHYCIVVLSK
eukprot:194818_1